MEEKGDDLGRDAPISKSPLGIDTGRGDCDLDRVEHANQAAAGPRLVRDGLWLPEAEEPPICLGEFGPDVDKALPKMDSFPNRVVGKV